MEPPSPKLAQTLEKLGLCTQADLRRCRSRVRSLAKDLPAFDSVWIDALTQIKVITPFQARILESSEPYQLKMSSYLLNNELGKGNSSTTYLCQNKTSREKLVLKRIDLHAEDLKPAFDRLESEISRLKTFQHPSIAQPVRVECDSGHLLVISRYVPGVNVTELIVRRGRIDPVIVEQVATQLLDALAALESAGAIHGDIRMQNIRLTDSGNLVLVDTCITPMVFPTLLVDGRSAPELYDGISPERIGTSQMPTASSDKFALGTVLWHLLAGRSPFPVGDPIAKLALFQTKRIEDIRDWVPDCPQRLAELIHHLTEPAPENRPVSFQSIRKNWKGSCRSSCKRLARFRNSFNQVVASRTQNSVLGRKSRAGVLIPILAVLLVSSSIVLLDELGFKGEFLNITSSINNLRKNQSQSTGTPADQTNTNQVVKTDGKTKFPLKTASKKPKSKLLSFPAVNIEGVLELQEGVYLARDVSEVGDLVIRGVGAKPAQIIIPDDGISIEARNLRLQNIVFKTTPRKLNSRKSISNPESQLQVTCQSFEIRNCKFDFQSLNKNSRQETQAISWRPLDNVDRQGMSVHLQNSFFSGTGSVIYLHQNPEKLIAENCLIVNVDNFLSFPLLNKNKKIRVSLRNLTIRNAYSAVQLRLENELPSPAAKSALFDLQNSVFDLRREQSSLIQLVSGQNPDQYLTGIELMGEGNLIPPEIPVVSWLKRLANKRAGKREVVGLDDLDMVVEGLSVASFDFKGEVSSNVRDSVIEEFHAPRTSDKLPGIQFPFKKK